MGALARPGPQLGSKGPPTVQAASPRHSFGSWLMRFLAQELAPYPGRSRIVLRMTVAATLSMLVIMTFRLPGAAVAAFYTLLLSRESPRTTLQSAWVVLVAYAAGAVYCVLGILLCIDYPLTHFLWVVLSLFLCFYAIKVVTNYVAAAAFAFIVTIVIPLWDVGGPTDLLLIATLWAAGSVVVGLSLTVATEYAFSAFGRADELILGLTQRLDLLSTFFEERSHGRTTSLTAQQVDQLATVGVSRLRRLAVTDRTRRDNAARSSSTISLVGRLVDLAAAMVHQSRAPGEQPEEGAVAAQLQLISKALKATKPTPELSEPPAQLSSGSPLLIEVHRTTHLLSLSLSPTSQERPTGLQEATPAQPTTLLPDAWTNPEHLLYALRGCLAATLCYVLINAVSYRALSTSLATCVITGMSSIGTSRQKQFLRLAGASFGGLVLGLGSQVFLLPRLDSIGGFTVLFVAVTWVAAWFATASPRLSYFGLQVGLAFYLINLQEFYPQTNLAIARDRVLGVGLGLLAMWLAFDTLGSRSAAEVMREIFTANLKLLAEFVQPWKHNHPADLKQLRTLRDKIVANFGSVNSQADGVLFETGPSRQRDLALRERLLAWQPQLRSLFFIQLGLLQYRTQVAPQELAPAIVDAQRSFDHAVADVLNRLAGQAPVPKTPAPRVRAAFESLRKAIDSAYTTPPPRPRAVLALSASLTGVVETLQQEMNPERHSERHTHASP